MTKKWDGLTDRRIEERRSGWRDSCATCDSNKESNKERVDNVCKKVAKLEAYHIRDVGEVKVAMDKKADKEDLRPIVSSVRNLIIIGCLVVGSIMSGSLIWLRADMTSISASIQRLNIRITESSSERIKTDIEQTQVLGEITGELKTTNYRLKLIEDSHKPTNRFLPDHK
jgi:hypothetical protein